jgi:hypothetical protein
VLVFQTLYVSIKANIIGRLFYTEKQNSMKNIKFLKDLTNDINYNRLVILGGVSFNTNGVAYNLKLKNFHILVV